MQSALHPQSLPARPFGPCAAPRIVDRAQHRRIFTAMPSVQTLASPEGATAASPAVVVPDVVAGTPASGEAFPLSAEQLITLAKHVHATDTGISDDTVLSDAFKFEFPIIKLGRQEYLDTVRGFQLRQGIPNLNSNAYDWRVDPYEPNRVWFTIRTTGTHTGAFKFGRATYAATGSTIQGPPECCSYTFDKEGKVTSFTGGYVMDNRVGNTDGLGAAFGILAAIGVKLPKVNSLQWEFFILVQKCLALLQNIRDKIFGKK